MENNKNIFAELNKINVSDKVETKDNLTYLSWSYAWAELKKVVASANYKIYENAEGLPYFKSNEGFIVKVGVTVEALEHIVFLPVMNGANKAMKETSYKYTTKYGEKSVEPCDMMAINKTIQRALVKAIAMHGLGLYIYSGEDLPEKDTETKVEPKKTIAERLEAIDPSNYSPDKNKASQKQINLLVKHNVEFNPNLTMAEASELIKNKVFKK